MTLQTRHLIPNEAGLDEAVAILSAAGRVAFPTETVYGLGADARSDKAVAGIYAAKDRPSFNPLIVHVADLETARTHGTFGSLALALAEAFWPGPLTMVLPLKPNAGLSKLVTAGLASVALRVPAAPLAQRLLVAFGGPIAAPSANPSGRISATTAAHVASGLTGRIEAILDGGPCPVGVESTILDLTGAPRLLRPGGLAREEIEAVLGASLGDPGAVVETTPKAPGMLRSHYAPRATLRLNAVDLREGERLLGFGRVNGARENLSPTGDLVEATANLFAALHRLDEAGDAPIAVSPIPETGLGRAINDRLRRAAAPRDI